MIAVTGATGGVGGRVARALAERGLPLRLLVRDASHAPDLGADVAEAEVPRRPRGDACRVRRSGETVFLVSAGGVRRSRGGAPERGGSAAAAGGASGSSILSFMGAAPDGVFTLARDHWARGAGIRSTGAAHTFLRSCMYAEYMPVLALPEGRDSRAAGDGWAAFASRDDIADVAAAAGRVVSSMPFQAISTVTERGSFNLKEKRHPPRRYPPAVRRAPRHPKDVRV